MAHRKPRKQVENIIEELKSWLPNYEHKEGEYPVLLFRILASLPGGDRLEDVGYERFNLGWHEADQLGRVLETIQDKRDVEDIVEALLAEDGEDLGEARGAHAVRESAHRRPAGRRATRLVLPPQARRR